jgi:DNA uptake protein ComE-like DNA-binding protein
MTTRQSLIRVAILPSALALSLLAAACAPAGEKGQTNATNAAATNSATTNAADANGAGAKLNLNTAKREEFLAKVPNLGDRMAHEFEEYRPYKSIQQFRREMLKYVAQSQVAEYERYVFVPVDENEADAATLRQIPGLDEREAAELVAGRPYRSRTAFVGELSERLTPEELAVAMTYLK